MLQVPHQVAGGEEGVSAVQHARLAAGPAGGQHGRPWAHTAAPPGDRERGVADDEEPTTPPPPAPPHPTPLFSSLVVHYGHKHPFVVAPPVQVLLGRVCGQATGKKENAQIFTATLTLAATTTKQTMHLLLSVPHPGSQEKDAQM